MKKMIYFTMSSSFLLVVLSILLSWSAVGKPAREFYQFTVYHYSNSDQEKILDNYLQNALLPALHRMNIKQVGVFKAIANDTSAAKSLYVLLPVKSLDMLIKIPAKLNDDKEYQSKGAEYINAAYTAPPYARMETIILQAFSLAPQLQSPVLKAAKTERVYELRSYESATEEIFKK